MSLQHFFDAELRHWRQLADLSHDLLGAQINYSGVFLLVKPVEVLAAYSHSTQAADLLLCRTVALTSPVRAARPSTKRPWSLRERLDEREITELITAYRNGATTSSLAAAHGVSLSSVKRLLHTAGVHRTPSTRASTKATPTAAYP